MRHTINLLLSTDNNNRSHSAAPIQQVHLAGMTAQRRLSGLYRQTPPMQANKESTWRGHRTHR